MNYSYSQQDSGARLVMMTKEPEIKKHHFTKKDNADYYTIAWNTGSDQQVVIDEVSYVFPANTLLPIMMNQSYRFEVADSLIVWQFNREFYCIVNHDAEVGCLGFIFYGPVPVMWIPLDAHESENMHRLVDMFAEEFELNEDIKSDMLRMLLVRLIIKITRLAKKQYWDENLGEQKYQLLRQYHFLVETHFKKEKQVQFYAGLLNKSPKTLSNAFALYGYKTPLQVIHERIVTETKRLLYYTDKSVKEIAYELGFEDVGHFSKFIKSCTQKTPSELK
ncbi:MAG: AraC family transcriptional regulator, partial [Prolixibacteraceae bacterium]|nr:AraC family transcriptional regulator [Prolixibacteraceae bacterium]